ncbi:chlorophyll a/b-binding protein [Prochlorothrix hollandica]|uniref:High light inducible protein n=1 Tax=Prochlorothrix hollandica PCC 9006 = CALU 1027 TaxID=317619 RepID=A0A0M2PPA4_PROHO|nr:chlorophyll a/b-binding protein [Prochlorothrix hollandica]KKI98099.1 high light inducible protein [Prochlorothrix hollandica PCC 9006 = CALU 1027]
MATRGYTTEDGGRLNNFAIEPRMYVDDTEQLGFTKSAEQLNGRAAMIGFISLVVVELVTGQGLLSLIHQSLS